MAASTGVIDGQIDEFTGGFATSRVLVGYLGDLTGLFTTGPSWSVAVFPTTIVITFADAVTLSGDALDPAEWTVDTYTRPPLTVTDVDVVGNVVTVTLDDEHVNGFPYTLNVPATLDVDPTESYAGITIDYTGVGLSPFITHAIPIDSRAIVVYISEPCEPAGLALASNWTMDQGASVLSVEVLGPQSCVLRTTELQRDVPYTLNVTGIVLA